MMKPIIACLLSILAIGLFAQERIAKGYVLDKDSRAAISNAKVSVQDTAIYTLTDVGGAFSIEVPKKHRALLISKDDYKPTRILLPPGFQHRKFSVYLESTKAINTYSEKRLESDSIFLTYKNTLTLSLIELFAVAIAPRYDRFLAFRHSLGLHASFYIYGRNAVSLGSEYDYYPHYTGFKLAPAYRFYPIRKKKRGAFIEVKIPFGYFNFTELPYKTSTYGKKTSIEYSFWTNGVGASIGLMIGFPKMKHGVVILSAGYQYFPVDVPETTTLKINEEVTLVAKTDTYWWYEGGPGSKFDLKITIGGIF